MTLDLSDNTGPFVQPASLTWQGRVNVLLPGKMFINKGMQLIAWEAPPDNPDVTFAAEENGRPVHLQVRQDGLWIFNPMTIIIIR